MEGLMGEADALNVSVGINDNGERIYSISSGNSVIYLTEPQAAAVSYALRGMIRMYETSSNEVVN
jgi:hypothetical protein